MTMLSYADRIEVRTVDAPQGRWQIATWAPADLAAVIDSMWYFDGRLDCPRERIFPQGRLELIVHLDDVYREVRADGADAYPVTCLSGQLLRSLVIESPGGRTAVLGIRLRPVGAFLLLGRPVHDTTEATVDLGDLVGARAGELADRCAAARGPADRLVAAAAWVRELVARPAEPDAAVAWAADTIESHHGRVSISALRERTGWSRTRFTTKFREQVGVTPKVLARVVRFRRALAALHAGEANLSRIAHSCGYYDHSHLDADFRDVCGFTPSQYRTAVRYPNSLNLAVPPS
jgi:AraC-like DNA-binding protein